MRQLPSSASTIVHGSKRKNSLTTLAVRLNKGGPQEAAEGIFIGFQPCRNGVGSTEANNM